MWCYFCSVFSKDLWLLGECTTVSFTFDCNAFPNGKIRKYVDDFSKKKTNDSSIYNI